MNCLIVAAGMGRRLSPYTDDRPKCLVEINGRSILQRQVDAYRAAGIDDIVIVRGYMREKIDVPGARYFENVDFRSNNILLSLFFAEPAMAEIPKKTQPRRLTAGCHHPAAPRTGNDPLRGDAE